MAKFRESSIYALTEWRKYQPRTFEFHVISDYKMDASTCEVEAAVAPFKIFFLSFFPSFLPSFCLYFFLSSLLSLSTQLRKKNL